MVTNTYSDNTPNAAKLIDSLRHLDYTNESALLDIVDNSIDANASQIWIQIDSESTSKTPSKITIVDNGSGMNSTTLDQAMRLGSDTKRNPECDLGLYGMGLVTASISMAQRLEVYTRNGDGKCLVAIQDLAFIREKNDFIKILRDADETEIKFYESHVLGLQKTYPRKDLRGKVLDIIPKGTIVVLKQIDNCKWSTIKGMSNTLKLKFGQTYRKFIQAGKCVIYINGEIIQPIDPIKDFEPTILDEAEIKLDEGNIQIKLALLKDYGGSQNKDMKINIPNQGFYVLRNEREIITGEDFGIFTKHNDFNRFRAEFSYPGTLDKLLSSNFSKSKIVLDQSLQDKVSRIVNPHLQQLRKKEKEKQRAESKEDFTDAAKYITRKSHLLETPKVEIEKRNATIGRTEKCSDKATDHGPRLNLTKRQRITLDSLKVKFETKNGDPKGPLYDADIERDVTIVSWNISHPFYQEVIAAKSDDPNVFNPLVYLVYCFACAELKSGVDSDTREIIENIRYDVGKNLAVLMH